MRAELIAVGSELLLGDGVDTNSAWIAARLAEIGVDVHRHTTIGDNPQRLAGVLRESLERADAVIMTGGLGPTQDDLTRFVVADIAGVELQRHQELVAHMEQQFARRGRALGESNLVQADIPVGARVFDPVGTAAGFVIEVGGRAVYAVPGVPREMRAMVRTHVVPNLQERGELSTVLSRWVHTAGMSESAVAEALTPLVDRLDAMASTANEPGSVPTIAFLASRGATRVRITAKGADRAQAKARVAPVVDEVAALLGDGVAGLDDESGAFSLARMLRSRGLSLAVGESVTGGQLGSQLVHVPAAGDWFFGGLITYATESKGSVAGVPPELLSIHGPVSEPVAAALAAGAKKHFAADVGLSVVGVAGPTRQAGQPVGTICIGVSLPEGGSSTTTQRLPIGGADADEPADAGQVRSEVQQWAAGAGIDYLRRLLIAEYAEGPEE